MHGGYTHANYIHSSRVLKNIDSYDETSAYPYVMVSSNHFPMSHFKKCYIKDIKEMRKWNCYILRVRFTGLECKYFNTFISMSKCRHIRGGAYDNGRVIKADTLEISVTDVDLNFICDTYKYEEIEILDSYYAIARIFTKNFSRIYIRKICSKNRVKKCRG